MSSTCTGRYITVSISIIIYCNNVALFTAHIQLALTEFFGLLETKNITKERKTLKTDLLFNFKQLTGKFFGYKLQYIIREVIYERRSVYA